MRYALVLMSILILTGCSVPPMKTPKSKIDKEQTKVKEKIVYVKTGIPCKKIKVSVKVCPKIDPKLLTRIDIPEPPNMKTFSRDSDKLKQRKLTIYAGVLINRLGDANDQIKLIKIWNAKEK